ncbi:hypothetical protein HK405_008109, partial [Cladochytrium tenue]
MAPSPPNGGNSSNGSPAGGAAALKVPASLPVFPTRNQRVLLPGIVMRLQYSKNSNLMVACVPLRPITPPEGNGNSHASTPTGGVGGGIQKSAGSSDDNGDDSRTVSGPGDLYDCGVAARIVHFVKNRPSEARATRASYVISLEDISKDDTEMSALIMNLRAAGHELASVLSQLQLPSSVLGQLKQMLDSTAPSHLSDLFASMIDLSLEEKLQILEMTDVKQRIKRTLELLNRQIQVLKISQKLQTTVENKLGQKQREFILRQQLDAIKKELGESDDAEEDEAADLAKRIAEAKLPEEAAKAAERELRRLKRMHSGMAEFQVTRTYLEWLAEVPWSQTTDDILDITRARKQLDEDHYGLEKVKTRVIEFLAVRKLKSDLKGPILCFVGPPGVGKTSLGRSIASAMGRKFHRISLGGVKDEAEIRGHRRTYIGALPDEIDKLSRDFRGDPASALLEVLDPEQNFTFSDHYLNVPYDLSQVLFIATANDPDTIPGPLMDRMEVIRISGYTFDEKLHIAKRYLLPKQIAGHGLPHPLVNIPDDVLYHIAVGYTREAGVRNLEREIAGVCRALAVDYADARERNANIKDGKLPSEETADTGIASREAPGFDGNVTLERVEAILGPALFDDEVSERAALAGVATGLAWTASGAGGLLFIEATLMPGKGSLVLTGKLGDVIKESAQLGLTWVRANARKLGLTRDRTNIIDNTDVHIHFPAGAIPKDVTALVSLFSGVRVADHLAMTGEMTLRGLVEPVGGIKEKVLAAHRGGIKTVILPFKNRKDLADVPEKVRKEIDFHFAKTVDEVLEVAFGGQ